MHKIIEIPIVESTQDCVKELNSNIKQSKWKRKTKFNIDSSVVRVFSDGQDTLSIVVGEYETFIVNYDLNSIRPLISKIQQEAKKIYTYDYGEIYLNPWDMKIWVVGGDGGIIKTDMSKSQIKKMMEDGEEFSEKDMEITFDIPEINEVIVEAEFFPPTEKDDETDGYILEWIYIGKANDLSDFDY